MKAIKAGQEFNLFEDGESAHVDLMETGVFVTVDDEIYPLMCGTTFEESQKVDALLDNKGGLPISDYVTQDRQLRELLSQYQASMVNLCRELGCDPDVSIASPHYYEDMASEAIMNFNTKTSQDALDPKGRIVLVQFGSDALLFRPENKYQPFVVAYDYDAASGEWSHGSYFSDLGHAYDVANPEIIEDATVRWELEDLREKLMDFGVDVSQHNIVEILARDIGEKPVAVYVRENMIASGHEDLNDHIENLKRQGRLECQKGEKAYSLSSEKSDMTAAKNELNLDTLKDRQEREENIGGCEVK